MEGAYALPFLLFLHFPLYGDEPDIDSAVRADFRRFLGRVMPICA